MTSMTRREDRIGWDGSALRVEAVYIAASAVTVQVRQTDGVREVGRERARTPRPR